MEKSAGILVYRFHESNVEVLLGKCGGPKWDRMWQRAWNIPKGHLNSGEDDLTCAIREFNEETSLGLDISTPKEEFIDLGETTTKTGKIVHIFAIKYDFAKENTSKVEIVSNLCEEGWPELSKAYYFDVNKVLKDRLIFSYQEIFIHRLIENLGERNMSTSTLNEQDGAAAAPAGDGSEAIAIDGDTGAIEDAGDVGDVGTNISSKIENYIKPYDKDKCCPGITTHALKVLYQYPPYAMLGYPDRRHKKKKKKK